MDNTHTIHRCIVYRKCNVSFFQNNMICISRKCFMDSHVIWPCIVYRIILVTLVYIFVSALIFIEWEGNFIFSSLGHLANLWWAFWFLKFWYGVRDEFVESVSWIAMWWTDSHMLSVCFAFVSPFWSFILLVVKTVCWDISRVRKQGLPES